MSGFGSVFTDVDRPSSRLEYYDVEGNLLLRIGIPFQQGPNSKQSLAFIGTTFSGHPIYRVRSVSGSAALGAQQVDALLADVAVMDDFIYGEPQAIGTP